MTQVVLQIDDVEFIPTLKKFLSKVKGVKVSRIEQSDVPNAVTKKAIKDAMENKNITECIDSEDLFKKLGI